MKRLMACVLAASLVGLALAQAPFTIVRPTDGSKVREDVHILFPKNSIPDGGYVGIYVNGKFIEATIPKSGEKFLDYTLHTKQLSLPDGPTNIEAILYVEYDEKPRIVDKSSIQVSLGNKANIKIPDDGFTLRYRWQPGREWVYRWDTDLTTSTITESQARLGGRAAEIPIEAHSARLVYAMDSVYGNGDALLRMLAAPPRGKSSFVLSTPDSPTPKRYFEAQMYPLYMRVRSNGNEVFGTVIDLFPFEGMSGSFKGTDLAADYPLPTLPVKAVKPGDSWQTRFQLGTTETINAAKDKDTLVEKLPARGEFQGLEWEMGYPCAKIHLSFGIGSGGTGLGVDQIKTNAQSLDETIWFAIDRGVPVKMIYTLVTDTKIEAAGSTPAPQAGGGGAPNPPPGQIGPRAPRRFGAGGGKFGAGGGGYITPGAPGLKQQGPPQFAPGQGVPAAGGPGIGGGAPGQVGPGQTGPARSGGSPTPAPSAQLVRVKFTAVMTLEK